MSAIVFHKNLPKTPEEYIEQELNPTLYRMAVRATLAKRMFLALRTLAIIGGALLPLLISINKEEKSLQLLSIIVSVIVALAIALEEALKFKENYIKLEGLINVANKLKSDFVSRENDFANLEDKQRIAKFASLIGNLIMSSQNSLLEAFSSMESPRNK